MVIRSALPQKKLFMEFPGGLVVKTWCFHWHGQGLIPNQGTKISQAM